MGNNKCFFFILGGQIMAVIGTTDGTGGGWTLSASGNVQGGTVVGAGNIDTSAGVIKNDLAIATIADDFGAAIGSKIVSNDGTGAATTDRVGVSKAVSGGTLAFQPATTGTRSEEWVIMGVSTKIGGVANSQLTSSRTHNDGTVRDHIHDTILAGSGGFANPGNVYDVMAVPSTNIAPNFTQHSASHNTDTANQYTLFNTDGTVAVSSEIFPTRTLPGELTYHFGGLGKPTTDSYKAKNVFES
jgi:hypothetical protein